MSEVGVLTQKKCFGQIFEKYLYYNDSVLAEVWQRTQLEKGAGRIWKTSRYAQLKS